MKPIDQFLKESIVAESSNVVPVRALHEILANFNIVADDIEPVWTGIAKTYKIPTDVAERLVDAIYETAVDDPEEIEMKVLDDLFGAHKILKKLVDDEYYLTCNVPGIDKAWVLPLTNQTDKLRDLRALIDNIKWKPSKHDVFLSVK